MQIRGMPHKVKNLILRSGATAFHRSLMAAVTVIVPTYRGPSKLSEDIACGAAMDQPRRSSSAPHGRAVCGDFASEVGDRPMYPLEDGMSVAKFFKSGGTVLKAIKRRCLDCSGNSKAEVRNCRHITCELHTYRFGRNPNRRMGPEKRRKAAARLKANIGRKSDCK